MLFRDCLMKDLHGSFLNVKEFGELVTFSRGAFSAVIPGLFDTPSLDGSAIGAEVDAISHQPRLFVSSADLPGNKPEKFDIFVLESNQFHPEAKTYEAVEFSFEKDGTVVYKLREVVE